MLQLMSVRSLRVEIVTNDEKETVQCDLRGVVLALSLCGLVESGEPRSGMEGTGCCSRMVSGVSDRPSGDMER